eukprot:15366453-Alexandrium_andersonii.AAC.1
MPGTQMHTLSDVLRAWSIRCSSHRGRAQNGPSSARNGAWGFAPAPAAMGDDVHWGPALGAGSSRPVASH